MFERRRSWPVVPHEEVVRRSRVLVIDDGEFPYLSLFERDGYTIAQWHDVDDMAALESGKFDLILLDLIGVGTKESSDEGFGLLKHMREVSPAQIVVAYSNADLSLEYQPFFRDADAVLHKTTDYVEFKRTVDRLLDQRFALGFYLDRIERELGQRVSDVPKARARAEKAILTNRPDHLREYLQRRVDDPRSVDRAIALVGTAAQIVSLWTN